MEQVFDIEELLDIFINEYFNPFPLVFVSKYFYRLICDRCIKYKPCQYPHPTCDNHPHVKLMFYGSLKYYYCSVSFKLLLESYESCEYYFSPAEKHWLIRLWIDRKSDIHPMRLLLPKIQT